MRNKLSDYYHLGSACVCQYLHLNIRTKKTTPSFPQNNVSTNYFMCSLLSISLISSLVTYVVCERHTGVVASPDGVGGGHHRAARLQRRHNAGLADGDALLLHGLVDRRAVLVTHLSTAGDVRAARETADCTHCLVNVR